MKLAQTVDEVVIYNWAKFQIFLLICWLWGIFFMTQSHSFSSSGDGTGRNPCPREEWKGKAKGGKQYSSLGQGFRPVKLYNYVNILQAIHVDASISRDKNVTTHRVGQNQINNKQ